MARPRDRLGKTTNHRCPATGLATVPPVNGPLGDGERADPVDRLVDLERQRREDDEATAERLEVEWATTSWYSLVAGACGDTAEFTLSTGAVVEGTVIDVGDSWCLVDVTSGSVAVALEHVLSMRADRRASPPRTVRPTIGSVLRRWARMRAEVSFELSGGRVVVGRVRNVLADAVTVAASPTTVRVFPFSGLVTVRGPRLTVEE